MLDWPTIWPINRRHLCCLQNESMLNCLILCFYLPSQSGQWKAQFSVVIKKDSQLEMIMRRGARRASETTVAKFICSSNIAKEKISILDISSFWYSSTICQYHHGEEMTTQAFKKKIYEVKVKTYFVPKPSNEIENQILVSYLNLF